MERQYVSKIVLELQPRSLRCCCYSLFGIRENKSFNKESFDRNHFTQCFLNEFNKQVLFQGQHIECMNLIVAVEQIIKRKSGKSSRNTRVEFRLRGVPFQNEENVLDDEEEEEIMNYSPLMNILANNIQSNSSSCCPECKRLLSDGEVLVKTENWSRAAVCSSCYESSFAEKCGHCWKPMTFDKKILRRDGSLTYSYVKVNGSQWHLDCYKCAVCSQSLVGKDCYRKGYDDKFYCYDHSG